MYAQVEKPKENSFPTKRQENRAVANSVGLNKDSNKQSFGFADNRTESVAQRKLQAMTNSSSQVSQLRVIQKMMTPVIQLERTVTNRMKRNMQESSARVFGGPSTRYQIDQESGSTFSDGAPNYTTGHHGVKVTDTQDGQEYTCDFHQDGAYYTRG